MTDPRFRIWTLQWNVWNVLLKGLPELHRRVIVFKLFPMLIPTRLKDLVFFRTRPFVVIGRGFSDFSWEVNHHSCHHISKYHQVIIKDLYTVLLKLSKPGSEGDLRNTGDNEAWRLLSLAFLKQLDVQNYRAGDPFAEQEQNNKMFVERSSMPNSIKCQIQWFGIHHGTQRTRSHYMWQMGEYLMQWIGVDECHSSRYLSNCEFFL